MGSLALEGKISSGCLGRAGLAQGMRAGEGVVLHACIYDPAHRRERREVVFVEIRSRRLARQAEVGDGDGVALAIAPGVLASGEGGLQRLQRLAGPVSNPFEPRGLLEPEPV